MRAHSKACTLGGCPAPSTRLGELLGSQKRRRACWRTEGRLRCGSRRRKGGGAKGGQESGRGGRGSNGGDRWRGDAWRPGALSLRLRCGSLARGSLARARRHALPYLGMTGRLRGRVQGESRGFAKRGGSAAKRGGRGSQQLLLLQGAGRDAAGGASAALAARWPLAAA